MQVTVRRASIIGALCASGAFGVLVGTLLVIAWPPDKALTQENPANFIERWVIPDARAADPIPPSEAQTPTIPRMPEDQPGARVIIPPMTKQESESEARGVVGKASYYAYSRGKTSSGAPNNPNGLTAAHRTLPFGTRLRVTDIETRKSVIVVVNDRGPAIRTREIDLTRRAAQVLQMISRGVAQVRIEAITATN